MLTTIVYFGFLILSVVMNSSPVSLLLLLGSIGFIAILGTFSLRAARQHGVHPGNEAVELRHVIAKELLD
jgi:hypothetical protein